MKTFIPTSVISATAFSLAVGFSTLASAGQAIVEQVPGAEVGTQTVSVQYARAELSTDTGRDALYGKIQRAAKKVCGPTGWREAGSLSIASSNRRCYENALAAAVSQIDSEQLKTAGY